MEMLTEWMDAGDRAIITATHQISDMEKLSDYLIVLKGGKEIGNYEKERLASHFYRYWFRDAFPAKAIPGEVERDQDLKQLISSDPQATETFMREQGIQWTGCQVLDLEEAITLLLQS